MKSGKLITGMAVGAVVALILIPKTRKMLSDAVCTLTDSFKDILEKTGGLAEKGMNEVNSLSDKTKDIARTTKEAWQS
ncbi:MAG: YtxH domain-containing protein [Ferruginibacter sp.]